MANKLFHDEYFKNNKELNLLSFNDSCEIVLKNDCDFIINVTSSNVNLTIRLLNDVKNINYTINISQDSTLKEIMIIDSKMDISINKTCNNDGNYHSFRIDLHNNDTKSIDNVNLNDSATCEISCGIYAANTNKKNYQTNLNHYGRESKALANLFAISANEANVSIYTDAFIKNGAHGCDSRQVGRIINMDKEASGIVLPNLHIDENDVVASHSCSVGSVNQDHIYYLQTRGFNENEARMLLIKGYFNPLLKNIDDENIAKEVDLLLQGRI